jgi:hypothetical protein
MRGRRAAGAALTAVTIWGLVACTPAPAPTPTPTGFTSEDEAFLAAESTYRAYIDALNDVDLSDPATSRDALSYLTGKALQAEIDSAREFDLNGIRLDGPIRLHSLTPREATSTTASTRVCLDVSSTRVINDSGDDVTPADRDDLLALDVSFIWTPTGSLISDSTVNEEPCS